MHKPAMPALSAAAAVPDLLGVDERARPDAAFRGAGHSFGAGVILTIAKIGARRPGGHHRRPQILPRNAAMHDTSAIAVAHRAVAACRPGKQPRQVFACPAAAGPCPSGRVTAGLAQFRRVDRGKTQALAPDDKRIAISRTLVEVSGQRGIRGRPSLGLAGRQQHQQRQGRGQG